MWPLLDQSVLQQDVPDKGLEPHPQEDLQREGPQRKVKGKAKERKELGDAMLQERMQEVRGGQLEDAFEDGLPDPFGFFQYQEMIEDMMARL